MKYVLNYTDFINEGVIKLSIPPKEYDAIFNRIPRIRKGDAKTTDDALRILREKFDPVFNKIAQLEGVSSIFFDISKDVEKDNIDATASYGDNGIYQIRITLGEKVLEDLIKFPSITIHEITNMIKSTLWHELIHIKEVKLKQANNYVPKEIDAEALESFGFNTLIKHYTSVSEQHAYAAQIIKYLLEMYQSRVTDLSKEDIVNYIRTGKFDMRQFFLFHYNRSKNINKQFYKTSEQYYKMLKQYEKNKDRGLLFNIFNTAVVALKDKIINKAKSELLIGEYAFSLYNALYMNMDVLNTLVDDKKVIDELRKSKKRFLKYLWQYYVEYEKEYDNTQL